MNWPASRFDTVRYVGMPKRPDREAYFKAKVPDLAPAELGQMLDASDGYSVAHMRELIILTRCFGVGLDEAATRLNKTRKGKPSSDKAPDSPSFGFNP